MTLLEELALRVLPAFVAFLGLSSHRVVAGDGRAGVGELRAAARS